jgi:hypothetical protein
MQLFDNDLLGAIGFFVLGYCLRPYGDVLVLIFSNAWKSYQASKKE